MKNFLCAFRYIKTSGNATVDHLSKYLAVRLALEELRKSGEASPINVEAASEKQYTIYIPTANNQFTVSGLPLCTGLTPLQCCGIFKYRFNQAVH